MDGDELTRLAAGLREKTGQRSGETTESSEQLTAALGELLAVAQKAWPDISIDPGPLLDRLAVILAASPAAAEITLKELHAGDLYLTQACLLGIPAALTAFDREFLAGVPGLVRRLDARPDFGDEVRQRLAERLLVASEGGAPRLATYSGRGPLAGWIGVAAHRVALSLLRETRRESPLNDEIEAVLSRTSDPELAWLKEKYRAVFQQALHCGLEALPQRERMILRLHLTGGVSLEKIAASYRVNQSTVSRWLAKAREAVLAEMRVFLEREHLGSQEVLSLVQLVRSQVDVALFASGWTENEGT